MIPSAKVVALALLIFTVRRGSIENNRHASGFTVWLI